MITTPRGIAIPLPLDNSFCLISRLYPKVKPYTVLETTAGFYKMHSTVGFITGILCFLLQLSAWQIAAITFVATLVGYSMSLLAIYPPGLLRLARVYSLLTGYGFVVVGLSVVGLLKIGLVSTGLFWLSRILAEFVTVAHANHMGRNFQKIVDPQAVAAATRLAGRWRGWWSAPDGFAVRCFGNAYATYATKLGVPIEALASQDELESGKWRDVLREFAHEWPQVVRRFQVTNEEWQELLGSSS
jgi:hypothetical protein